MNYKGIFSYSNESIDVQTDTTKSALDKIIKSITGKVNFNNDASKEIKALEKFIFSRFGMSVTIVDNESLAAVMPLRINDNHVFTFNKLDNQTWTDDYIGNYKKFINGKTGFINLKKAIIGGVFSLYRHNLYLDFKGLLSYDLDDDEISAIILHELGHIFTFFEYADRLETTNIILQTIANTTTKKEDSSKNIEYMYKELQDMDVDMSKKEIEDLINNKNIIPGLNLFQKMIVSVKNQTSVKKTNLIMKESVADNFAARFGYGRQLISGLHKLHKKYDGPEVSDNAHLIYQIYDLYNAWIKVWQKSRTTQALGKLANIYLVPLFFFYLLLHVVSSRGEFFKSYTYTDLKNRYQQIRNETVGFLKNDKLDKDQIRAYLATIVAMDEYIGKTKKFEFILDRLANYLISDNKNIINSNEEQRLLEELSHNDLFIKSAEIKTL